MGSTNPSFGGSTTNSIKKMATTTTSKSPNEGIEQNSKAYIRLYEKSVPREEKEEEVSNETEHETSTTASMAAAAASESSAQNKEMNSESSDSLKEQLQSSQSSSLPLSDPVPETTTTTTTTKTQLQSQLLSKDAMYQNQIDVLTETSQHTIHQLETNLKVLQHEYSNYQTNMTEQLNTAQVTASEKEHALFEEITTLLSALEAEQQALRESVAKTEQLQQGLVDLQQTMTAMQQEYTMTVHDLEDDYEMEQTARTKERAEHVSELVRLRQEAVAHVEAVERAATEQTDRVRADYSRRQTATHSDIERVQVKLTNVQQSLRDREDLIAEWAADRASAKSLTRQLWQLLRGRVVARARRIKSRLRLWFSDEAP
jgi:hypothetical protein